MVILGSAPERYLSERMKCNSIGITLRYSERFYKKGRWRFVSPRGIWNTWNTYYRYKNRNLFMLCASAFTSSDLYYHRAYIGKCYKWGYFPELLQYNQEDLMRKKQKENIEILWCGRLIDWKHPELSIKLAHMLKIEGINFIMNLIGTGDLENEIRRLINEYNLNPQVKLLGAMEPDQVRRYMEKADVFLSTSDFEEGWGAVINEAMNSGCAVVSSHGVGAAPYLIKDGINGMIFQNGNLKSLLRKVLLLVHDKNLCAMIGRRAYETILHEWNAQEAVRRLLLIIEDLNQYGESNRYLTGPCSKAELIRNNWYKEPKVVNKI